MTDSPAPRPPIDPARLVAPVGWRIEVEEATPSTNAAVAARARDGERTGPRRWSPSTRPPAAAASTASGRRRPASSLTFSVLLRPDVPPTSWPWLPLLTGYAVQARAGRPAARHRPEVAQRRARRGAWTGRKVAGILVERIDTDSGPMAVVGVGHQRRPAPTSCRSRWPPRSRSRPASRSSAPACSSQVLGSLHGLAGPARTTPRRCGAAYADVCVTLGSTVDVHLPAGGGTPRRGARHRRDRARWWSGPTTAPSPWRPEMSCTSATGQ